jgi:adenylate cyclase
MIDWIRSLVPLSPGDGEELVLEKKLLVYSSPLIMVAAAIWGAIFLYYGEMAVASVSLGYTAFTLLGLYVVIRTRRYRWFVFIQFVCGLAFPFIQMVMLGGFWQSGTVMVWTLITPLGTLVFYPRRQARFWWLAYLALFILAGLLQNSIQHANQLPLGLLNAFTVLNLTVVSSLVLFSLAYFINKKNQAYRLLRIEEQKADRLLLNVLPKEIAPILKNNEETIAEEFEEASVLYADLVGFTPLSSRLSPVQMVELLNEIFTHFDALVDHYGVEKIRTIGDNYMVAAGVPRPQPDHAQRLARLALDMRRYLEENWTPKGIAANPTDGSTGNPEVASHGHPTRVPVQFRIGINSGPVIGGVIGRRKFVYDVWGDAVNIASRMESHGLPGKIQISQETHRRLCGEFACQPRGTISVKGKGQMRTWFLEGLDHS